MKIYFITTGTAGDVMPFIEMARASSFKEEAVIVANEKFRGMALAQGLAFHPHSTIKEYESAINNPALWSRDLKKALGAVVSGFQKPIEARLQKLLLTLPDATRLVIHPLCGLGDDTPFITTTAVVSPAMLGTEFVSDAIDGIGLWPEWFHPGDGKIVPTDFRILVEPIPVIDGEIHRLLEHDPVLITFGSSSTSKTGHEATEAAIQACIERDRKVLLIGGPPMTEYAEYVTHVRYMPLWYPLKRVTTMIHHGGIGTAALCFRTATKQIIHPFGLDQFDNAGRCLQLGEQVVLDHDFGRALDQLVPAP